VIEKILPGLFRIIIPLPIPVVHSVNAYIILDPYRNLIIDPGMNHVLCYDALQTALKELNVDLTRTDFFMTHHHVDHFGLVSRFLRTGSVIYTNAVEAGLIEKIASRSILQDLTRFLQRSGFPETDPMKVLPELLGNEYRAVQPWPFRYVFNDDVIRRGRYVLTCIVTPGHSPGHTCLWEPNHKILFSGDAILPEPQFISDQDNPLLFHLESLKKLRGMEAGLFLPGHGNAFGDYKEKIKYLEKHHEDKAQAILLKLAERAMSPFQVAEHLHDDHNQWEALTPVLKHISARDAFAHLRYLEEKGKVRSRVNGARLYYVE